jgi:hypothetical protein
MGLLDLRLAAKVDRKQELEAKFCQLLNEKLKYEQAVKNCEAEMFRIQGALAEVDRPDPPVSTGSG